MGKLASRLTQVHLAEWMCVCLCNCICKGDKPKSLLDDDGRTATALVSLVFLVRTVSILYDRRCLPTPSKPLLSVVTTKLTLYQDCCLGHPLEVHELYKHRTMSWWTVKNTGHDSCASQIQAKYSLTSHSTHFI